MTEQNRIQNNPSNKEMKGGETITMKKKIRNTILIIGFVFIVALCLIFVGNQMNANAIKEKQEAEKYNTFLAENCECIIQERYFCSDGFVLTGNYCVNKEKETYTLRLKGCSQYDCSGEIKIWNNETEEWQNQN